MRFLGALLLTLALATGGATAQVDNVVTVPGLTHSGVVFGEGGGCTGSIIYNTTHASNQGAEITAAANGAATTMADLIVLAGTNRSVCEVQIEAFTLASTAPFSLTMTFYTDCTSSGAAGSACGTGAGVLIPLSTVTVTGITPPALGTIFTVIFPYPNVDISSEADNTIAVAVNASRNDVFWRINETPAVGSLPPGEPATSFVQRCGSVGANNGCMRNFGVNNNFAILIEAELGLAPADVSLTKTDGLTSVAPGGTVTYTITASNAGPNAANNCTVTDTFPAGLSGVTWTCAGAGGGTCTAAGAGNISDTVNLPNGGSVTYTVTGTASGALGSTITNTASVAVDGATTSDPNTANNSASDDTQILSPASVSCTKTVAGELFEGGAITYTVVCTNSSATAQQDNPGDEFTDVLPASVTVTGASASSGTAGFAGNTVTWNGSIPGNGSVTITINATINAGTVGQTISNQGTFSYDADGNGTNEASGSTDDPGQGGQADPTQFVVGQAALVPGIPALSTGGLVLLGLAIAGLALFLLRRKA
ncbi:MAG TPA: hypothetical protein VF017_02640 [Thermoanaerobaculia bacterium]|nr:hypothetical protein [Thermoanaerobaculia bacterium]